MRKSTAVLGILLVAAGAAPRLSAAPPPPDKDDVAPTGSPAVTDVPAALRDRFLAIGKSYRDKPKIDAIARVAPALCMRPVGPRPFVVPETAAAAHTRKLYFLYANDRGAYLALGGPTPGEEPRKSDAALAPGAWVVKESWDAVEAKDRKGHPDIDPARIDGKLYYPGERGPLYVLAKLERGAPDTDEGWVYGTLTPDGKTVTAAGKLESCVRCHKLAKHERLFGK